MFGMPPRSGGRVCAAVALIGKDDEPLYFRVYDEPVAAKELYFQSLAFVALDNVDDCVARKVDQTDMYLGFLCPVDEFQIYGYMTNTKIKLMVVLDDQNKAQEADLRAFFQRIHGAYVEHLRNPFAKLDGGRILSKKFGAAVDAHVSAFLDKPTDAK
ncbi:Sedlin [Pelagophyceae sp. CCMP2097]|nr:Sedlin [Pelagophyceae sp. CCMP2097]